MFTDVHTMDSQLTLVNPSEPASLILSKASVKNTSIYLSTDPETPLYHVTSSNHDRDMYVQDARTRRIIATIQWKDVLPDMINFPAAREGESSTKARVSRWMRKGTLPEDG